MPDAHSPVKAPEHDAVAPAAQQDHAQKGWWQRTKESFQASMPDWVVKNSSRINQLGLMAGTAVIMGSALRNRTISKIIWKEQEAILKGAGYEGAALKAKIDELMTHKDPLFGTIMKKAGLHKQRVFYLSTAVAGLGIGGFIKDKETPEDREKYKDMSLPHYMATRFGQAFDPLHHSRQTAGVVGAASGVLAMISAFSQPGGALISEAFVGATLISGFTGLTFVNDPAAAKSALNVCWATRLPFVISGTYETLFPPPRFTTPLALDLKQSASHIAGMQQAMQVGEKIPRFGLGLGPKYSLAGRKIVFAGKAADAFTKRILSVPLSFRRMDVSYPIGQWFNMAMATFGFLMAGSDDKKKPQALPAIDAGAEPAVLPAAENSTLPVTKVHTVHAEARVSENAQEKLVAAHA